MQKIKTTLFAASLSLVALLYISPVLVTAQTPKDAIQEGVCDASGQANCNPNQATNSINDTIATVINILSVIVGIVAVIMIIYAGFRYITSAGNEQNIATAKRTLIYAIIGLIIVALAQVIARFVLRSVT
jgi:hypothetical protein